MFTLANERIVEESTVWDAVGLVQPVGAAPVPA
jgi:hypothetical protein